jgi:hypothetical protein
MAKPASNHELGATIGTGLGKLSSRSGNWCLHDRFEHGRRPPKLLLGIRNYFSHKMKIGTLALCMASRQPNYIGD